MGKIKIEDFLNACSLFDYRIIRVKNRIFQGDKFKRSCLDLEVKS